MYHPFETVGTRKINITEDSVSELGSFKMCSAEKCVV